MHTYHGISMQLYTRSLQRPSNAPNAVQNIIIKAITSHPSQILSTLDLLATPSNKQQLSIGTY
jgi:hypothetical protein